MKKNKQKKNVDWLSIVLTVLVPIIAVLVGVASCFIFGTDNIISNLVASFVGFLIALIFAEVVNKAKLRLEDKKKIATDDFHYDKEMYLHDVHVGDKTTNIWYYPLVNDINARYAVEDSPLKYFELDNLLTANYTSIMQAHQGSFIDNPTMIRLDDCTKQADGSYKLLTSRTAYFNDLVTNRSMDYKFSGSLTVRKIYESGKHLTPLSESKMSNHIGIIAHVFYGNSEILAERGGTATISKNKFTTCVAAGLSKQDIRDAHGLNERHPIVTAKDLLDGVLLLKLADRLNLPHDKVLALHEEGKIKVYLLGLGQLIYTGGKPQFYYAVVIDESVDLTEINARPVNKNQIDYNKRMVTASSVSLKKNHILNLQCDGFNLTGEAERSFYIGLWHLQTQPKIDGVPDWVYAK